MRMLSVRTASTIRACVSFAVLAAVLVPSMVLAQRKGPDPNSLYRRIGGYDVIAGIVDDFLVRLKDDKKFERFGGGRASDSLGRARQLIVDQICNLSGGPCVYIGRDMKTAHHGLGITKEEWDAAGQHLTAAIDKFKIKDKEKGELMAAIDKLRPDIVEEKTEK